MELLSGFFFAYPLLGLVGLLAQIYCIVHVIRNGGSLGWIALILFFPVGGPLIYFFVEIWPELRGGGGRGRLHGPGGGFQFPKSSARTIAKIKDELEFSNTVANRVRLAQALASAKRFPEAIETLNECLRGTFRDDALLTYERARIGFAAALYTDVLADLAKLDELRSKHAVPARWLLEARCHEALGDVEHAGLAYERALTVASGEEARCRYALLLEKNGRTAEAREFFGEIKSHGRRADGRYRRANREWIKTAKERLSKG